MTAIIFSLFFLWFLQPVKATSCYKLKFPALTAEQIKEHKERDLGNRKWLTPGWGSNVEHFDLYPERFTAELAPALSKGTYIFEPSIEPKIAVLEERIRKFIQKKSFLNLPAFALRGIKYSSETDKLISRKKLKEKMQEDGYASQDGGNFFVFYPGEGVFSPAKVEYPEAIAELFLARIYASSGSVKRYAGGLDGEWGMKSGEPSAVILLS